MSSLPTQYEDTFNRLSIRHFQLTPHEWQTRVGGLLIQNSQRKRACRMLCIQGTGSGKSLLYQTLCTHFKGVALYVSPLLTLGADQANKLLAKTQVMCSKVIPISLDVFTSHDDVNELISLFDGMDEDTTAIVFASPQTITNRFPRFVSGIKQHLNFIVIDEIHIFNAFGRSFRGEFGRLKTKLFKVISAKVPMLFLTATCTDRIRLSFERMIGLKITHVDWPPPSQFMNRRVSLLVNYSQKPFQRLSSTLGTLLKFGIDNDENIKCIVYSNIRTKLLQLKDKIGEVFDADDKLYKHDILAVHGNLTNYEKQKYIEMFLDPCHPDDKVLSVLCATSGVANVGLDSPHIRAVYRVDYPGSIIDIVQESGRAGRVAVPSPQEYSYHLSFCLESFMFLYQRAIDPDIPCLDPLYRKEEVMDLMEVGKLLLFRKQCMYVEMENYLGNPRSVENNFVNLNCGVCPYCRNDERIVPIIVKDGIRRVFFNVFNPSIGQRVINSGESVQDIMTLENLIEMIRNFDCDEGVNMLIIGRQRKDGIKPDTIKRVIFLLIVTGILDLSYDNVRKNVFFTLAHSNNEMGGFALMDDAYWINIDHK